MRGTKGTGQFRLVSGFSRKLYITTTIAMIIVASLSLLATVVHFNSALKPYLVAKAEAVATSVKQDIEYALHIGIPFEELRGLDEHVANLISEHPEISTLEVTTPTELGSRFLARSSLQTADRETLSEKLTIWNSSVNPVASIADVAIMILGADADTRIVSVNIEVEGTVVAQVLATVDDAFISSKMTSVFFDTLVILIAVALVALEVVVVFSNSQLSEPFRRVETALRRRAAGDLREYQTGRAKGRIAVFIKGLNAQNSRLREALKRALTSGTEASRLTSLKALGEKRSFFVTEAKSPASIMDARIPLFVFCFAEELQKSFLPLFVAENYSEGDLFARDIMMGLPISAFMFVIAAFTPYAGRLVDRFGNKALFLAGLAPAVCGYFICFMATSGNDILLGRSITAVGYAIITISCQSYIAAVVDAENRARGMAIFVGVLMTATMCGTAIGAILAEWLGYKSVFLVAICFSGIAGLLGWKMLSTDLPAPEKKKLPAGMSKSPFATLMRNTQFVLIVLFCAIPAKIILTGFMYLFVPIYLASLDATQSEIGRIMMLYSLIIIPISPLASGFADRLGKNLWMVIIATIASGIVLMALYQSASVAMVLVVVAALGIVHAFLKAPLIVAAMEAAEKSPDITRTGALSLLRTSERIGSVIGPVVVAAMLVILDYGQVAAILGASVTVLGVVMAFLSLSRKGAPAHA
ncbi:MAG: MFS transporter [Pseudomonadota bacterium]